MSVGGLSNSDEFHHVILEHFYRDTNGMKYCSVTGLTKDLVPKRQESLYTFSALQSFADSIKKNNKRHILSRHPVQGLL